MKKKSVADQIELKIRMMSEKYKSVQKNSLENVMNSGRFSSQDSVNDLLRKELKEHLPILKMSASRDVSHLKDLKIQQGSLTSQSFPTEIMHVKKLLEFQKVNMQSSGHFCVKSSCIERNSSGSLEIEGNTVNFLENLDHGLPSSRKAAENLRIWFETMEKLHYAHDDFEVVLQFCEQELLKQVSVECKVRGQLLKSLFMHIQMASQSKSENFAEKIASLKASSEKKIQNMQKSHSEALLKSSECISELKNSKEKYLKLLENSQEETQCYKRKLQAFQKFYLEEQEVWRKHLSGYMKEANRKEVVYNNESHKLAVLKWRKGLFETESESLVVNERILEKIENGEELSTGELEEYREVYMKKYSEEHLKMFLSVEVQTEIEEVSEIYQESVKEIEEKEMEEKETQTDFFDGFNENELIEIENILQESLSESEDDRSQLTPVGYKSLNSSSSKSSAGGRFSEYINFQEMQYKSPVYMETLGIVKETKSEIEFLSDNEEENGKSYGKAEENKEEEVGKNEEALENYEIASENYGTLSENYGIPSENHEILSESNSIIRQKYTKKVKSMVNEGGTPKLRFKMRKILTEVDEEQEIFPDLIEFPNPLEGGMERQVSPSEDSISLPEKPFSLSESFVKPTSAQEKPLDDCKDENFEFASNLTVKAPLKRFSVVVVQAKPQSERRPSMPLNLKRPSLMHNDSTQAKISENMKQIAQSLMQNLKNKKKELAEIEALIESKRKELESSQSIVSDHTPKSKPFNRSSFIQKLASISQTDSKEKPHAKKLLIEQLLTNFKPNQPTEKRMKLLRNNTAKLIGNPRTTGESPKENKIFNDGPDQMNWKNGYSIGYSRGKTNGLRTGRTIGREEGMIEGYIKAIHEINGDDSLFEDSEPNSPKNSTQAEENLSLPVSKLKTRRSSINTEIRPLKETTKFAEFKFAKQRANIAKSSSPALSLIKKLLLKSSENILKKATISRKMINKMLSSAYQAAIVKKNQNDTVDEILIICYEEIAQKYGLKKVTDRKFLEFIASVIKNKAYKKCLTFLKFAGFGSLSNEENYSKYTLMLYLDSLQFMLNSKVGIALNYEESDDKSMFPVNRAMECVKEKLENKAEKSVILSIMSSLEHKALPDQQRINTGLIDLEFTLQSICDAYELFQKSIRKGLNTVLHAFNYSVGQNVLQYDFAIIVRSFAPSKFQRLESEEIITQELTSEEAYELCVELQILSENEVNAFAKNYSHKVFHNYSELDAIIDRMQQYEGDWVSVSEEEWKKRISEIVKKWDENSIYAAIAWRVYECELLRIEAEYL